MTRKNEGRADWHQATSNTSINTSNSTCLVPRFKALIVTLALWGWFPISLADWINKWGGSNHE